jgi:hypothetical protein
MNEVEIRDFTCEKLRIKENHEALVVQNCNIIRNFKRTYVVCCSRLKI